MPATVHLDVLKDMRIASPCSAEWGDMLGNDKTRHCAQCNLDVHNVACMTRVEVETLVAQANGRFCARLYRRADGTVLTADCPVGLAAVRARARRVVARAIVLASAFFSASLLFAQPASGARADVKLVRFQPFKWAYDALTPVQPPAMMGDIMVGKIAQPPSAGIP